MEKIQSVTNRKEYHYTTSCLMVILIGLLYGFGIPILIDSKDSDDTDSKTRVWLYCVFYFVICGVGLLKDIVGYIFFKKHSDNNDEKEPSGCQFVWGLFCIGVMIWGLVILGKLNAGTNRNYYEINYPDLLILFEVIIYFQVAILCIIALALIFGCCIALCFAKIE